MCDRDWKRFKVKNLKYLQRKTLENLENGEDILQFNQPDMDYQSFIFQSAPKFLDSHCERDDFQAHASLLLFLIPNFANVSHKDQWKHLKSVCVTVEFNGKYQSKNVAKHNMCLVSADISYF